MGMASCAVVFIEIIVAQTVLLRTPILARNSELPSEIYFVGNSGFTESSGPESICSKRRFGHLVGICSTFALGHCVGIGWDPDFPRGAKAGERMKFGFTCANWPGDGTAPARGKSLGRKLFESNCNPSHCHSAAKSRPTAFTCGGKTQSAEILGESLLHAIHEGIVC